MNIPYPHFEPATNSCKPLIEPTKGPEPTPICGPGITGQYGTVYCNSCGGVAYGQCAQLSATEWVRCVGNKKECTSYNCFTPDASCAPLPTASAIVPTISADQTLVTEDATLPTPTTLPHNFTPDFGVSIDSTPTPVVSEAPVIAPSLNTPTHTVDSSSTTLLPSPTLFMVSTQAPTRPTAFSTNTPVPLPESGPNDLTYFSSDTATVARNIYSVVEERGCRNYTQLWQFTACFCNQFVESCSSNQKIKEDAGYLFYRLSGGRPLQCLEYVNIVLDKILGRGFSNLPTDYLKAEFPGCGSSDSYCRDKASAFIRRNNTIQTILGFQYIPAASVSSLQSGDIIVYKGLYETGSPGHINICNSPFGIDCRVCEANKNGDGKITCNKSAQPYDAIYRKL